MIGFQQYLTEGDSSVHRALSELGYKRPVDKKSGELKEKDRGTYKHRKGLNGDHLQVLTDRLKRLGFKHEPSYDPDLKCLNHTWTRGGQRLTGMPEYMAGHIVTVEGA